MNDDRWAFPPQPPAWPPAPSTAPARRASRTLTVVALFVATGIVAAGVGVGSVLLVRRIQGTPSSPGSPPTAPGTSAGAAGARALYQQALAATRASTGFHYVGVSTGGVAQTIDGDAGQSGGRQAITVDSHFGTEQFTLLLVGTTVYFQGNVPAVEDQLGVPAASAAGVEGKWVSVVTGNGPYGVLQPGITASSQATQMPLVPESSARATTAGGVAVTRVSGAIPAANGLPAGTGSLDIAPRTDLPISYTSTVSGGGVVLMFTTTFSAWGTAPSVSAPTGATAWSSLSAVAPPGGYGSGGTPAASPTATPGAV
jgi:hypothetical protein